MISNPENILPYAALDGTVRLIDFGIASKAGARRLTFGKLSQLMGTADYISPEQVKGNRGDIRSDLFALGVIFYEMLTGGVPYRGTNPLAVMNDRLINKPLPPTELNPELLPVWEPVLYKALARNPRERFGNASEFAHYLEHPSEVQPVNSTKQESPNKKNWMFYFGLSMLPASVFVLLIYLAHHQ